MKNSSTKKIIISTYFRNIVPLFLPSISLLDSLLHSYPNMQSLFSKPVPIPFGKVLLLLVTALRMKNSSTVFEWSRWQWAVKRKSQSNKTLKSRNGFFILFYFNKPIIGEKNLVRFGTKKNLWMMVKIIISIKLNQFKSVI